MIRDRITSLLVYLVRQIYCSTGGILLGRVTGAGIAQEITLGTGLSFDGTTLNAAGSASDTAYDAGTWNGVTTIAPSKNAVRDKLVAMEVTIAGKSDMPAPLALSAPPSDGIDRIYLTGSNLTGGAVYLTKAATQINGRDFYGVASALVWSVYWNGATKYVANKGSQEWESAGGETHPALVSVWTQVDSTPPSTLVVTDASIAGDVATALGQLAIVSTTNASGDFEDVWTASNLSPMTWQPPGQITRSPDGTLYRAIVDNTGIPSTELAYP